MYQRWTLTLLLAPWMLAALTACRGPASTDDTTSVSQSAQETQENWLCQTSASGDWACRRDADPDAQPRPTQLPVVDDEPPAPPTPLPAVEPTPTPKAARAPAAPATQLASPAAPAVSAPAPAPVTAPQPADDPALPLYRQLAYQSDSARQLTELPSEFYALQLFAMSSQEELAQFVNNRQLQGMTTARVERNGELFYVLIAGIYENSEAAERAALSIEAEFDVFKPWVRPLRTLQSAVRRAEHITDD